MLQRAMQSGVRLWQFPASDLGMLAVTAVGYCLLGFYVFKRAARSARWMGVLGHY
jgi:ABC-2 type transport system permease protein